MPVEVVPKPVFINLSLLTNFSNIVQKITYNFSTSRAYLKPQQPQLTMS